MALPTLDMIGNLVKDVDVRFSQSGIAVVNGTIAANRSKKDQQGNWETVSSLFQPFTAFGPEAENIAEAGKGSTIRLVGTLETDQWEDKTSGEKRSMTKLKADFVKVIKAKDGGGFGGYNAEHQQAPQADPWANPNQNSAPF